jgi:hypothetical protein
MKQTEIYFDVDKGLKYSVARNVLNWTVNRKYFSHAQIHVTVKHARYVIL